jgi:glyoxylase-like metal-dependent hydrolase (beta-lactamase superfamily II)/8-oxo-dGTP pyrophosphatase MutT (NUDIX family)
MTEGAAAGDAVAAGDVVAASAPIPAATVVLTRPAASGAGLEVLLTRRPPSMAFAPDMHVFPGGRIDAADEDPRLLTRCVPASPDVAAVAAIREAFEEVGLLLADLGPARTDDEGTTGELARARASMLAGERTFLDVVEGFDLRLRTDLLVPLSRWVTPPIMPRRFDVRFFVAAAPDGVEVTLVGDEVAEHGWHRPRAALDSMAAGGFGMWIPTSGTLQQLEHVGSMDDVRSRLAPGEEGTVEVHAVAPDITRISMPAGGGVDGQPVFAYLIGRRRFVLVDPGDPTGPGLDRAVAVAAELSGGGSIAGIALTQADPDHVAGAEGLAEQFGVPVFGGPGAGRDLPFDPIEVGEGSVIEVGDVPLRVVETPGLRPDHVAFVVGEMPDGVRAVIAGDLDGVRGARSVPGPVDEAALARSVARLRSVAPGAPWFGGHPRP